MIAEEIQRITTDIRINKMRQKCLQAWVDNQLGATLPPFMDRDFETHFEMFITDAIENNKFWDLWDKVQTI